MSCRLVVGLGNPGTEYQKTRHNFGFLVLEAWASELGLGWKKARFADAEICELSGGRWLVKPLGYMNCSGPVVGDVLRWFKLEVTELLVVVDEVNLPLGRLRLRNSGSAGGHNGLASIEQSLGTRDYARLRGGVGKPEGGGAELAGHVLGRFDPDEWKKMGEVNRRAREVIEVAQTKGVEAAMNFGNGEL